MRAVLLFTGATAIPALAQQHPFVEVAQQVPAGVPVSGHFEQVPDSTMLGGGSVVVVGIEDISLFLDHFGSLDPRADVHADEQIDQADVDAFDEAFQACSA